MLLIKDNAAPVFDTDQVHRGDLIRAKHETWDDYRNGLVIGVKDAMLVCLYYADYGNVSNHYTVLADEVSRGEWLIQWTSDMETIYELEMTDEEDEADSTETDGETE